jgi:hypothetical protein
MIVAARIAMITTTMSTSTSVKPERALRFFIGNYLARLSEGARALADAGEIGEALRASPGCNGREKSPDGTCLCNT